MKRVNFITLITIICMLFSLYMGFIAFGAGEVKKESKHAGKGISCNLCHGSTTPEKTISNEKCIKCHGSYADLGKKTVIHTYMTVPHFGGGDNCGRCHHEHKASESLCIQCHSEMENMKVP